MESKEYPKYSRRSTTYQDFLNSLGDKKVTKEEFEKEFLAPQNDDISIEDIDVDSIKLAAKIVRNSIQL